MSSDARQTCDPVPHHFRQCLAFIHAETAPCDTPHLCRCSVKRVTLRYTCPCNGIHASITKRCVLSIHCLECHLLLFCLHFACLMKWIKIRILEMMVGNQSSRARYLHAHVCLLVNSRKSRSMTLCLPSVHTLSRICSIFQTDLIGSVAHGPCDQKHLCLPGMPVHCLACSWFLLLVHFLKLASPSRVTWIPFLKKGFCLPCTTARCLPASALFCHQYSQTCPSQPKKVKSRKRDNKIRAVAKLAGVDEQTAQDLLNEVSLYPITHLRVCLCADFLRGIWTNLSDGHKKDLCADEWKWWHGLWHRAVCLSQRVESYITRSRWTHYIPFDVSIPHLFPKSLYAFGQTHFQPFPEVISHFWLNQCHIFVWNYFIPCVSLSGT